VGTKSYVTVQRARLSQTDGKGSERMWGAMFVSGIGIPRDSVHIELKERTKKTLKSDREFQGPLTV